jgi:hypothetical protein
LRFDIKLFYPSIDHKILLNKLPEIYQKISGKKPSKRLTKLIKNELPYFLRNSPYNKGIPIGSNLSKILAEILLLEIDTEIKRPFLRQADDYLVFCKTKKEPGILLKNIILPKMLELNLEINEKKIKSGKFHQDRVSFIGYEFVAGYFTISEEKIEQFKRKIIKITRLNKKKPIKAIIKQLNNKVLGFGHYYKFANSKKIFLKLDSFVRMRLRRYLNRIKDSKNKTGNLILTNEALKSLGLKSLADIPIKYARKTRLIFKKKIKTEQKTSNRLLSIIQLKSINNVDSTLIFSIFNKLNELTKNMEQIKKKVDKIDKKLKEKFLR